MFITFPKHWSMVDCVNNLQRRVLLNSILYYERDKTALNDAQFKLLCEQLIDYTSKCSNVGDSEFWYVFHDFDISTTFDLYHRLTDDDKTKLNRMVDLYERRTAERDKYRKH